MSRREAIVSVVAGGWSFSQVPHGAVPGLVIAVNDAGLYLRKPNVIVSMDRLWVENRWQNLECLAIPTWLRRSAVQNLSPGQLRKPWLHVFDCDNESVEWRGNTSTRINGTNSGTCALGYARFLEPEVLYLFGFDMQDGPKGEAHWYPPYPWVQGRTTTRGKFREWAGQFKRIREQFEEVGTQVINVSDRSLIKEFPVRHPKMMREAA